MVLCSGLGRLAFAGTSTSFWSSLPSNTRQTGQPVPASSHGLNSLSHTSLVQNPLHGRPKVARQCRRTALRTQAGLETSSFPLKTLGAGILVWAALSSFRAVPAGYRGVQDTFGKVEPQVLSPGYHLRRNGFFTEVWDAPVRTQLFDSHQEVPTSEGLLVGLDISLQYHLQPDDSALLNLYTKIGKQYVDILIQPELRSAVRNLTAKQKAQALYSAGRKLLGTDLQSDLNGSLNANGIVVEQVLLRGVYLPKEISTAIQNKLKAEQESERMQYVISKEQQEAERKRVEAEGIAKFQEIVATGISERLLEWKGIEATEKLAESPNAKIVIIGNTKNGLPLVLGDSPKLGP